MEQSNIDILVGNLRHAQIPGLQSNDTNWNELQQRLVSNNRQRFLKRSISVAASLVALVAGILGVLYAGNVQVENASTQSIEHVLPDNSHVVLHTESSLSYNQYLWLWERKLKCEGEAFFEVEKGETFTVESALGSTTVLGTSFNVYARKGEYTVSCYTGKVKVTTTSTTQQIVAGEELTLGNQKVILRDISIERKAASWMRSEFDFDASPLGHVFDEVARRYDYSIAGEYNREMKYSGYFKQKDLVHTLNAICGPSQLTFTIDTLQRKIELHDDIQVLQ